MLEYDVAAKRTDAHGWLAARTPSTLDTDVSCDVITYRRYADEEDMDHGQ